MRNYYISEEMEFHKYMLSLAETSVYTLFFMINLVSNFQNLMYDVLITIAGYMFGVSSAAASLMMRLKYEEL
jgi:hypothetical protein